MYREVTLLIELIEFSSALVAKTLMFQSNTSLFIFIKLGFGTALCRGTRNPRFISRLST
jgi:hypothetical protein